MNQTIHLGKNLIKSIKQQTDAIFPSDSIHNFNEYMDEFISLKKEIPLIEQTYIQNDRETDKIKRLKELSTFIKQILLKSYRKEFNSIQNTCNYLTTLIDSINDSSFMSKDELKLFRNIKSVCQIKNDQILFKIEFLPSSLSSMEQNDKENTLHHKEAINMLKSLPPYKVSPSIMSSFLSSAKGCESFLNISHTYKGAKIIKSVIAETMEKHKNIIYYNSWNIDVFRSTIQTLFQSCKKIDIESTEGVLFICSVTHKCNSFVIKFNNSRTIDSQGVLHEFIVGSCLNQIRNITSGFMYIYGGFFCSSTTDGFQPSPRSVVSDHIVDICSLDFNKAAFSTMMITEYIEGKQLKEYANNSNLHFLLDYIFYSLKIAYKTYRFCHNDLHAGNIIVKELQQEVELQYDNKIIQIRLIPQIIDYGKSQIDIGNDHVLYPFKMVTYNRLDTLFIQDINMIEPNQFPSYDWLRLLITLSVYMKHPKRLEKYIQPFLSLKYKKNDDIVVWLNTIQNDQPCKSFLPKLTYRTAYEINLFEDSFGT